MAWLGTWGYRKKIKISRVLVESDQVDFPVTIYINSSAGRLEKDLTAIFDELSSSSLKLAITTENGVTECPVEIEYWDDSSEIATLHFKAPAISSSRDNYFYLYYDSSHADNTSYVGVTGSTIGKSVWDSDFLAVYHMAQDPTGGGACILDSTSNAKHGTPNGSMTAGDLVSGHRGVGLDFDGNDDYISLPLDVIDGGLDDFNVEAFFKSTSQSKEQRVFSNNKENEYFVILRINNSVNNAIGAYCDFVGGAEEAIHPGQVLGYNYISIINDEELPSGNGFVRLSVNGINEKEENSGAGDSFDYVVDGNYTPKIGNGRSASDNFFIGVIDEVRLSKISRSAHWVAIVNHSLHDSLITYYEDGEEEALLGQWLPDYDKRIAFTIDGSLVASDLTDFPISLRPSSSCGINYADISAFFDELGEFTGDDFTGTDGDPPSIDIWENVSGYTGYPYTTILSNALEFDPPADNANYITRLKSSFVFTGEFDVQIAFDHTTFAEPSSGSDASYMPNMIVRRSDTEAAIAFIQRRHFNDASGDDYNAWGTSIAETDAEDPHSTGKIRIVRNSSDNIYVYYWNGSSWEWDGNGSGLLVANYTSEVYIELWFEQAAYGDVQGTVDNFVINSSGSVAWRRNRHPNRKKVAVTDSDGITQLPVECAYFGHSSEVSLYYTKVPLIQAGLNKKIYLYYDVDVDANPFVGDIGEAISQSVWDDNFKGVWHIVQNPENDILDSTDSELTFTATGTWLRNNINSISGVLCTQFAATRAYNASGDGYDPGTGLFTIESLARTGWDHTAQQKRIYSEYGANTNDLISLGIYQDNKFYSLCRDTEADTVAIQAIGSLLNNDLWIHYGVRRNSQTEIEGFVNGTTIGSDSDGSLDDIDLTGGAEATIGCWNSGGANSAGWEGEIAEVRISDVARSDAWLRVSTLDAKNLLAYASSEDTAPTFSWLKDDSDVPWRYRIPIVIDHSKIDSNLADFPLSVSLGTMSGISSMDASHFFEVMDIPDEVNDDFTGTNGDLPNRALWKIYDAGFDEFAIQNNKCNASISSGTARQSISTFEIAGDFDIQFDYDLTTAPNTERWGISVKALQYDNVNHFRIKRGYESGAGEYAIRRRESSTNYTEQSTSTSDTSGKLRIVRVGNVFNGYYWSGSAWVQVGTGETISSMDTNIHILLEAEVSGGYPTIDVNFDNFVVNSGTVVWAATDYGQGKRVAFTSDDGITELFAELDYIKIEDKKAIYHVKIPIVSSVLDTQIFMYYDSAKDENSTYIGDVFVGNSVWDDDFIMVQHMSAIPSGVGSILDSTSNALHMQSSGMSAVDIIDSGMGIGIGYDFDGVNNYLTEAGLIYDGSNLRNQHAPPVCYEAIAKQGDVALGFSVLDNQRAAYTYSTFQLGFSPANVGYFTFYYSGSAKRQVVSLTTLGTDWHYICGQYSKGTDGLRIIVDRESAETLTTSDNPSVSSYDFLHAAYYDSGNNPVGKEGGISEYRMSKVIRSDAWLYATYETLNDSLNYLSTYESWLTGYDKRIKVIVDSSKIDAELTDFPLAIILNDTNASELFTELGGYSLEIGGSPGSSTDDFDTFPEPPLWNVNDVYNNLSQGSGVLIMDTDGAVGSTESSILTSPYMLSGDFSIKVRATMQTWTSGSASNYPFMFRVRNSALENIGEISKWLNTGGTKYIIGQGEDAGFTSYANTDNVTTFRITRVSGVVKVFEWDTDNWKWNGSTAGLTVANSNNDDLQVQVRNQIGTGADADVEIDYYIIDSVGDIVWPNNTHPNRKKIAVATVGGQRLNTELEWSDIEGDWLAEGTQLVLHSKIPTLPADNDTVLFVYFDSTADDSGEVGDSGSVVGAMVWDGSFGAVFHFSELADGGVLVDSTENNNDGTPTNMDLLDSKAGPYGYAWRFGSSGNEYAEVPYDASFKPTDEYSIEALVRFDVLTGDQMVAEYGFGDGGIQVGIRNDDGILEGGINGPTSGKWVQIDSLTVYPHWNYLAMVMSESSDFFKQFIDGVRTQNESGVTATYSNVDTILSIGRDNRDSSYLVGRIAELRLSQTPRSDAWVKATHYGLSLDLLSFEYETTISSGGISLPQINVGGSWKTLASAHVCIGGVWKTLTEIKLSVSEAWKALV